MLNSESIKSDFVLKLEECVPINDTVETSDITAKSKS